MNYSTSEGLISFKAQYIHEIKKKESYLTFTLFSGELYVHASNRFRQAMYHFFFFQILKMKHFKYCDLC